MEDLPDSWVLLPVRDSVANITITDKKIPQKSYLLSGCFPIFDQGQEYVGGYTNDAEKVVDCQLPVIVFGDHTRAIKYVKTPFAPGADGVKILQPEDFFCPSLFAYFVTYLITKIPNNGYARHYQHLAKSLIPVPPENEQHRIVAKIEELFSELDKGVDSLKNAREQLKVYRQALLKYAFEGKLTAQWRAENSDKLETASALQQRIQTERQERHRQQLADWDAKGKQGSKPKAPKPLPPLTAVEMAELPKLPTGWGWVRPEEICAQEPYSIGIGPFGSNLKVSDYRGSGIPLIFVKNITRSNFVTDLKYIDEAKYKELQPHSVRALDLLITKMGDPPGDCEIYPEGSPNAVLTADCLKFRIWNEFADRKLYKFCINSSFVKRQLGLITRGVAQKKISVERFKTICLPLFSVEEQWVLIQQIDEKLSEADQLDQTLATALQQSAALRQSILKKAFCGQLVKQDKNDEPASVLLERTRAARLPASGKKTRLSTAGATR